MKHKSTKKAYNGDGTRRLRKTSQQTNPNPEDKGKQKFERTGALKVTTVTKQCKPSSTLAEEVCSAPGLNTILILYCPTHSRYH